MLTILCALRELRWFWVKVRRRVATPLRQRRIRSEDNNESPADYSFAPALPWLEGATLPGNPECFPWNTARPKSNEYGYLAEEVCAHRLKILSSAVFDLNSTSLPSEKFLASVAEIPSRFVAAYSCIDWHKDFHSGYRWDATQFYLDIRVAPSTGVDIKTPRELSRFQHIGALAAGSLEQGGLEFLLQMLDWIASNPPRRGVNWACTMDVALRVVNWIWGLRIFEPAIAQFPGALRVVTASIYQHARHIESNLEYYEENTGNHYLSDVAGLLYVGAAFSAFPEADRWLLFGLQELVSEMDREVYADGGAHEASTHYHRLVAELFTSCAALAERISVERRARLRSVMPATHRVRPRLRRAAESGINLQAEGAVLPESFYARLAKMGEFTAALTKPNGGVPQFGDNDSARVHKLFPWLTEDASDHSHLTASLGELLNRDDLRLVGKRAGDEGLLLAGDLSGILSSTVSHARLVSGDAFFPLSGIAIQRRGSAWLAVTCGANGQGGRGGHGHNDKLSFELNVGDLDFIVDGGCPAYSAAPDVRNRFRSTWAHSTVAVSGLEQDPLPQGQGGLFRLPEHSDPRLKIESGGCIIGSHNGYGTRHERRFWLTENHLRISDRLELSAERWLNFNLDPSVSVQAAEAFNGRASCRLAHSKGVSMTLIIDGVDAVTIGEGCFSRGFGVPVPTANIRMRMAQSVVQTTLVWS